nr:hypothetical protein Itr_chr02CG10340 [Ipomoea trifida]
MEFSARSRSLREAPHWDFEAEVSEPLRLVFFNTSLSKFSTPSKKAETTPKSTLSIVLSRSIEDTLEALHVTPVKLHGFAVDTQFCKGVWSGMVALKDNRLAARQNTERNCCRKD